MPSGKELIRLNSVAHLLNQLAAGTLAGQPNAAGTQAAQNVAGAEQGIQGGLAQGKQQAMEEEAKKKRKKDLLGSIVGTVVGTAASAIPVVGPIVGPMAGAAAKGAVSGDGIDPAQVALAGVGGIPGTVDQSQIRSSAGSQFGYGEGNPVGPPVDPNQAPTSVPGSAAPPTTDPSLPPSTAAPAPLSAPAPVQAQAPTQAPAQAQGQQQAVADAGQAVAPPALTPMPQAAPAAAVPLPPTAPTSNPNQPAPMGFGQRIASVFSSQGAQSISSSIQQYLAGSKDNNPPSVYAPGLDPQTSMAIDEQFAARADREAQRQIQEEQLGLQREGLGLDKSKLVLEGERLKQEAAANQAMQVLETGKLNLNTFEANSRNVQAENTNKLTVYDTQARSADAGADRTSRESIATKGDAAQIKAAGISAGASLEAAKLQIAANKASSEDNRSFQAAMANSQNIKPTIAPDGSIIMTGTRIDPKTLAVTPVAEAMPGQTAETKALMASLQQDARTQAQAPQIVQMALKATADLQGNIDASRIPEVLPNILKAFGIASGTGLVPPPATPPTGPTADPAAEAQRKATTEANDAKLKALRTGQATVQPGKSQTSPEEQAKKAAAEAVQSPPLYRDVNGNQINNLSDLLFKQKSNAPNYITSY